HPPDQLAGPGLNAHRGIDRRVARDGPAVPRGYAEPRASTDADLDLALLNDDIANPIAVALPGIAPGLEQGCDPGCILTELRSELGEVRCEFGDGELVGVIEDADGFDVAFLGNEIRQRGDTLAGR